MKKFKVVLEVTNFETYEVWAEDADTAERAVLHGEYIPVELQHLDAEIESVTDITGTPITTIKENEARPGRLCVCGAEKTVGAVVCWNCWGDGKSPFKYFDGSFEQWQAERRA
jgi:hypothetical protein